MTQVKKTYAEITGNRGNKNEQLTNNNDNPALKSMEKEVSELKTLIHLVHTNNIENNKIITTLQAENKQLNHKIGKLQQQNSMKPNPYIEDSANFQQNINDRCIIILKQITISIIAQSLIHKQTITNEKVMTKRIIETAKDIIRNLTDLNINPDDMDIIDEDDNISSSSTDSE